MTKLTDLTTRIRHALADLDEATTTTLGSITATTQANPVEVTTSAAHGLQNGNRVLLTGVTGMPELNNRAFTVSNVATLTFELTGEDGSGYAAPGTAGTWTKLKKPLWSDAEIAEGLRQALSRYSEVNPVDTFAELGFTPAAGAAALASTAFASLATLDTQPARRERLTFTISGSSAASGAKINIVQSGATVETIEIPDSAASVDGDYTQTLFVEEGTVNNVTFTVEGTVTGGNVVVSATRFFTSRELDISSISGLLDVSEVWLPVTQLDPEAPPNYRDFDHWRDRQILYFHDYEPDSGDIARVFYSSLQTIEGLDSATATTLPARHDSLIVKGAAGYTAWARALDVVEKIVIDSNVQSSEVIMKWCLRLIGEEDPKGEFIAGLEEVEEELEEGGLAGGVRWVQLPALDKYDGEWA